MQPTTPVPDLQQDCITKLHRVLDLALKTAETASTEGNHKVVIQAAREVTRIVTLINKMTLTSDPKPKPKPKTSPVSPSCFVGRESKAHPAVPPNPATGKQPPETPTFNLEALFPPQEVAAWDAQSQDLFKDISRNWAELQEIAAEMNRGVQKSVSGNGKSAVHK